MSNKINFMRAPRNVLYLIFAPKFTITTPECGARTRVAGVPYHIRALISLSGGAVLHAEYSQTSTGTRKLSTSRKVYHGRNYFIFYSHTSVGFRFRRTQRPRRITVAAGSSRRRGRNSIFSQTRDYPRAFIRTGVNNV